MSTISVLNTSTSLSGKTIPTLEASNTFTGPTQTISNASASLNITVGGGSSTLTLQPGFLGMSTNTKLQFLVNNSTKWAMDTDGALCIGASSKVLSPGTPTISAGGGTGGTVTGRDYAFVFTAGTGSPTSVSIAFSVTFANTPIAVITMGQAVSLAASVPYISAISTTGMTISTTAWSANDKIYVQVIGI